MHILPQTSNMRQHQCTVRAEREGVLLACQVWHVELPGLNESLLYGWRVGGSNEQHLGHRHDATCVVLDPYASTVVSRPTYGTLNPSSSAPSAHTATPQGVHATHTRSLAAGTASPVFDYVQHRRVSWKRRGTGAKCRRACGQRELLASDGLRGALRRRRL